LTEVFGPGPGQITNLSGLPAQPFKLAQYDPQNQTSVLTGGITHVFWSRHPAEDRSVGSRTARPRDHHLALRESGLRRPHAVRDRRSARWSSNAGGSHRWEPV